MGFNSGFKGIMLWISYR